MSHPSARISRDKPGRRRGGGRAAAAPACATVQRSLAFDADTWQAALIEQLEALELAAGAHALAAAACRLTPPLPAHPVRLPSSPLHPHRTAWSDLRGAWRRHSIGH